MIWAATNLKPFACLDVYCRQPTPTTTKIQMSYMEYIATNNNNAVPNKQGYTLLSMRG